MFKGSLYILLVVALNYSTAFAAQMSDPIVPPPPTLVPVKAGNTSLPAITVSDFLSKERLPDSTDTAPSRIFLGPARTMEKYEVKGYVREIHRCPPCPKDALCEVCASYMIVSDTAELCVPTQAAPRCQKPLLLYLDYDNNYVNITPGTEIVFHVERSLSMYHISTITPEQRRQSDQNGKILENTLDQHFKRRRRPDELKDIPGNTWELK